MSWTELTGIVAEARAEHETNQARKRSPVECPEHGWPLTSGPDGEAHCEFGGHVVKCE